MSTAHRSPITDNRLLAPNGKPSLLNPIQYKLVRSVPFLKWFGNWLKAYKTGDYTGVSKVLDSNFEPLLVYHGSYDYGFSEFKDKFRGTSTSAKSAKKGFFFFDKKILAERWAKRSASGGVYECFLNLRNPVIKDFKKQKVNTDLELVNLINKAEDGVIAKNLIDGFDITNQYIAFKSNQIKLAVGVNKTFDVNNPDIRFSNGGSLITVHRSPFTDYLSAGGEVKSNLTPEQLKIVKSHKFRMWFGDWMNEGFAEKLLKQDPIVIKNIIEQPVFKNHTERNKAVKSTAILLKNEYQKFNIDGREINISVRSLKKSLRKYFYNVIFQAAFQLKDIIEKSYYFDEEPNNDFIEEPNIISFYVYFNICLFEGKEYICRITIRKEKCEKEKCYFLHDFDLSEIKKSTHLLTVPARKAGGKLMNGQYKDRKINLLFQTFSENISKVVNNQGFPLVVFHGFMYDMYNPKSKFYQFKSLPAYFSANRTFAEDYASEKSFDQAADADIDSYACFLNIKKLFNPEDKEVELARQQLPDKINVSHGTFWMFSADIDKEAVVEEMSGIETIPPDANIEEIKAANIGDKLQEKIAMSQYETQILLFKDDDWAYTARKSSFDEYVAFEVAEFILNDNPPVKIKYHGKYFDELILNKETWRYEYNKEPEYLEFLKEVEERKKYYIENALSLMHPSSHSDSFTISIKNIKRNSERILFVKKRNLKEIKVKATDNWTLFENDTVQKFLTDNNFGGWIALEKGDKTYAVYNAENIKLADGTNTKFDIKNKDIRFSNGGKLKKEKYERKREWAANRMEKNKEITTLTEEQHDILSDLASFRHELHINQFALYNSEHSQNPKFNKYIDTINDKLKEAKLPSISLIKIEDIPSTEDRYNGIIDNTDEAENKNRNEALRIAEEINSNIEKYLRAIDEKHGTDYAPSGASRIFSEGGEIYLGKDIIEKNKKYSRSEDGSAFIHPDDKFRLVEISPNDVKNTAIYEWYKKKGLDEDIYLIDKLIEKLKSGVEFDPIVLNQYYKIMDGNHRLVAYRKLKIPKIKAYIRISPDTNFSDGGNIPIAQAIQEIKEDAKSIGKRIDFGHNYATLYHGTSEKSAKEIKEKGFFRDGFFFPNKGKQQYGDSVASYAHMRAERAGEKGKGEVIEMRVSPDSFHVNTSTSEIESDGDLYLWHDNVWRNRVEENKRIETISAEEVNVKLNIPAGSGFAWMLLSRLKQLFYTDGITDYDSLQDNFMHDIDFYLDMYEESPRKFANRAKMFKMDKATFKRIMDEIKKGGIELFLKNKFSAGGEVLADPQLPITDNRPPITKLLAPNGKPSNLSEKNYKLVRSVPFLKFFGNFLKAYETKDYTGVSKILDENFEPAVVYHGTYKKFNKFDVNKIALNTGNCGHYGYGFYFSYDIREAQEYGKKVYSVFLNIKNVFKNENEYIAQLKENGIDWIEEKEILAIKFDSVYNAILKKDAVAAKLLFLMKQFGTEKGWDEFLKEHKTSESAINLNEVTDLFELTDVDTASTRISTIYETLHDVGLSVDDVEYITGYPYGVNLHWITDLGDCGKTKEVTDVIKKLGYDGIEAGTEIIAFKSNQIKLSNGKNTTFDASNPDIRFAAGGELKSNLTPEQLKIIHTPEFIEWFGAWDKKDNINKFCDSDNYEIKNIRKFETNSDAIKYYCKKFNNYQIVNKNNNHIVTISNSAVKKVFRHNAQRIYERYFENIDEIFSNSIFVCYSKNIEKNEEKDIPYYSHYFLGIIDNDGKEKSIYITIANTIVRTAESKILNFKIHDITVFDIKKSELIHFAGSQSTAQVRSDFYGKDKKLKSIFQEKNEEISKVLDSNGLPLVVWHGTNADFNIFKPTIYSGIYFSAKKELAELYGKAIPFFINAKKIDTLIHVKNKWWKDKYSLVIEAVKSMIEKNIYDCILLKETADPPYYEETEKQIYSDIYIVNKSEQIKLADGSNTTFNINNPDIRFNDGGSIENFNRRADSIVSDNPNKEGSLAHYSYEAQLDWLGKETKYYTPIKQGTEKIKVYRSLPKEFSAQGITDGNYVSNSKQYATDHAKYNLLTTENTVVEKEVYLNELYPADAPNEFWYVSREYFNKFSKGGIILERGQLGEVNDYWDFNSGMGQAGNGIYFYIPNPQMRKYYSKENENIYRVKLKDEANIIDLTKEKEQLIDFINKDKKIANTSNYQTFAWDIMAYMNKIHPDAHGYIIQHKGIGIPTGKQVILTKPEVIKEIVKIKSAGGSLITAHRSPFTAHLCAGGSLTTDNRSPFTDNFYSGGRIYWGNQAGGCIFYCPATNHVLVSHRSEYVFEPDTWGTWGGKTDGDETIPEALEREIREETRYTGEYESRLIYIYKDKGFEYHNYLVVVPEEFIPELDWENQGYGWFDINKLPARLHFGFRKALPYFKHAIAPDKYESGGYFESVGLEGYLVGKSRNPYIGKEKEIKCYDENIRCFVSDYNDYRFIYVLNGKNISAIHIDNIEGYPVLRNAYTLENYRKKGYAEKLYLEARKHLGKIEYSTNLSPLGREFKEHVEAKYEEGGKIYKNIPKELLGKRSIGNIGFGGVREHTTGKVKLEDLKVLDNAIENAKNTLKTDKSFKPSKQPITVGVDINKGEKQLLDGYHRYIDKGGVGECRAYFIPMRDGNIIGFSEIFAEGGQLKTTYTDKIENLKKSLPLYKGKEAKEMEKYISDLEIKNQPLTDNRSPITDVISVRRQMMGGKVFAEGGTITKAERDELQLKIDNYKKKLIHANAEERAELLEYIDNLVMLKDSYEETDESSAIPELSSDFAGNVNYLLGQNWFHFHIGDKLSKYLKTNYYYRGKVQSRDNGNTLVITIEPRKQPNVGERYIKIILSRNEKNDTVDVKLMRCESEQAKQPNQMTCSGGEEEFISIKGILIDQMSDLEGLIEYELQELFPE